MLPIGVLGLVGYAAIICAWLVGTRARGIASAWAVIALLGLTMGGTLLSAYLTFLEPFVIGATCVWCLTSAIAITVLMWLAAGATSAAWRRIRGG